MRHFQSLLLAAAFVLLPAQLRADDIRWRASYAEAYAEATKTGKPMFMDFGSENCYWCKRLEATTFQAPEVAKLINERFVPVRIDATVDVDLARAVTVQALPTLFVLAPDRTILNRHEGYAEAPQLIQFLTQGLERLPLPPPPMIAQMGEK